MRKFHKLESKDTFRSLGAEFFEEVDTEPLDGPFLIDLNPQGIELLGLEENSLSKNEWVDLHNGELYLKGTKPISSYYSGHQFGVWAGRLGDGRAHTLGEVNGYELQLKGAGLTPFSRMGDGRAVLRSTIREYLASEYLHALGIPTTRSLGIIGSQENVYREHAEKGAIMIRLAPSFVRFGTFEYFASQNKNDSSKKLLNFIIEHYFPEIHDNSNIENFYTRVINRTAQTVAKWMAYGFCHGVMNTDNMSILGLTIDYGPYGFLENYDSNFICNHSDHQGRYRYQNQPEIAKWNLMALAFSLKELENFEHLNKVLEDKFDGIYLAEYNEIMCKRFGLSDNEDSHKIIHEVLELSENKIDLNRLLYSLSVNQAKETYPELTEWLCKYRDLAPAQLNAGMKSTNPKFVLKNWVAQTVIDKVEKESNYSYLSEVRTILQSPFDDHNSHQNLSNETPDWGKQLSVSCSS